MGIFSPVRHTLDLDILHIPLEEVGDDLGCVRSRKIPNKQLTDLAAREAPNRNDHVAGANWQSSSPKRLEKSMRDPLKTKLERPQKKSANAA